MLDKFFGLKAHKTNIRTEVIAGVTTFMTMAYILAVNPDILSATGMDKNALVYSHCTFSCDSYPGNGPGC
jgi:adenine/guanine/hypoxanthine permease